MMPVLALVAVGLSACSDDAGPLPDASKTLQESAAAMKDLTSIGFTLTTEGKPPIQISGGDVKLLRSGDAQGVLNLQQGGQSVETDFVLLGDVVYFKGPTGGYQKLPRAMVAAVYDPSAILDPQRGISKLLSSVKGGEAEATEKVGGKNAHRVKVTLPASSAATLVPGITKDLSGQVWIGEADKRLLKVRAAVPAEQGGEGGTVVVTFTEFGQAYKITAPK
jgi:lipoprotein LprG